MSRNQPLSAWTPGHYPVRVFSSADPFGGCPRPSCRGPRPGLSCVALAARALVSKAALSERLPRFQAWCYPNIRAR